MISSGTRRLVSETCCPAEADGEYAAMKDISARNFDSEDEFDAYYDRLDEDMPIQTAHLSRAPL